ncbi:MAG: hypothetical protein SGPRY_001760, partial [Prymnesium sp.]
VNTNAAQMRAEALRAMQMPDTTAEEAAMVLMRGIGPASDADLKVVSHLIMLL